MQWDSWLLPFKTMDNRDIRLANLRYAIRFFGGASTLAEKAECSPKYLSQIVQGFQSGNDRNPRKLGDSVAAKIAKALHKEPYWMDQPHPELWDDEGELASARQLDSLPRTIHQHKEEIFTLNHYEAGGRMGNGGLELRDQPGIIESWRVNREWLEKNVRGHSSPTNLCIVTGFGDSMKPMFNPGDPLILDAGVKVVDFDAVYFFRVENEGFIKRLQRIPGKGLTAISENNSYRDWVIDGSMDFEVFGRILKVWRSEDV